MDLTHLDSVRAMTARGMSQREIAEALGTSQSHVGRLLRHSDTLEGENRIAALNRKLREHDERNRPTRAELEATEEIAYGYGGGKLYRYVRRLDAATGDWHTVDRRPAEESELPAHMRWS